MKISHSTEERIPSSPPEILPIDDTSLRPLWSVMIPVYNGMEYLQSTLESILVQDQGIDKMQIEVIDDCSTDGDVADLVFKVSNGRINYFKQEKNKGSIRNTETCINRARGFYVHILHADDQIKEGFYKEIDSLFDQFPEIGAAFTDHEHMDSFGNPVWDSEHISKHWGVYDNFILTIAKKCVIQYCSIVVKRTTYEKLGCFYGLEWTDDWLMWVRIAASYPIAYSPKVLAKYRVLHMNKSYISLVTGQNLKDKLKGIDMIQEYVPLEYRMQIKKESKKIVAIYYSQMVDKLYHDNNNKAAAISLAHQALKLDFNLGTLFTAIKIHIKSIINY
jgi:glycosyltransferase involved in cell wall biosynthesis